MKIIRISIFILLLLVASAVLMICSSKYESIDHFYVENVEMQRINIVGLTSSKKSLNNTVYYMVKFKLKDGEMYSSYGGCCMPPYAMGIKDSIRSIALLDASGQDMGKELKGVNNYKGIPYALLFMHGHLANYSKHHFPCREVRNLENMIDTINEMTMNLNDELHIYKDSASYYFTILSTDKSVNIPERLIIKFRTRTVTCHVNHTPLEMKVECIVPSDADVDFNFFQRVRVFKYYPSTRKGNVDALE